MKEEKRNPFSLAHAPFHMQRKNPAETTKGKKIYISPVNNEDNEPFLGTTHIQPFTTIAYLSPSICTTPLGITKKALVYIVSSLKSQHEEGYSCIA